MPGANLILSDTQRFLKYYPGQVCERISPDKDGSSRYSCGTFWLGTDHIGRDILSRMIAAARFDFFFTLAVMAGIYLLATPILASSRSRFWMLALPADGLIAVARAIPVFIAVMVGLLAYGTTPLVYFLALFLVNLPSMAECHANHLRQRDRWDATEWSSRFSLYALLSGVLRRWILVLIVVESLAYLGLGPQPPHAASFGGMINSTRQMVVAFPHMALFPILGVCLIVLALRLLADTFENALPIEARPLDFLRSLIGPGRVPRDTTGVG